MVGRFAVGGAALTASNTFSQERLRIGSGKDQARDRAGIMFSDAASTE